MTIKTQPNSVELTADLPKRIKKLVAKAESLEDLKLLLNTSTQQKQEEIKSVVMKKNK